MKVAYVYSGARKDYLIGTPSIDYPDSILYGANHLEAMPGLKVTKMEMADFVPNRKLRKLLGFRILHALTYFFTMGYDVVIGSSLLYALLLRKIYRTRSRYIVLNFSITRLLLTRKSSLSQWGLRWVLQEADSIVCLSRVQQEALKQVLPEDTEKIVLIPLGVDDVYNKPHYDGREDFILSVGRDNGRDYATLIDVARELPDRRFVIICHQRNLKGISDIPDNVTVFYNLPPQELNEYYRRAKMLVLTTHDDSFGAGSDCSGQTVLLEAMASGLPLIASRKKYIYEYVREGEDALLVDFYDTIDLVEKIKALDDPELGARLTRNARARIEKEFSTRIMAEHLYKLIQKTR